MARRYIVETLRVAQVPVRILDKRTIAQLLKCVSFIDVSPDLMEYMISVGSIHDLLQENPNAPQELRDLYNEVKNYQYLHLTTI